MWLCKFLPKPVAHKVCLAPVVPFITEPLGKDVTFCVSKGRNWFYFHPKMVEFIVDLGNFFRCFSAEALHRISFRFFAGSSMATSPVPCRMVILLRPRLSTDP